MATFERFQGRVTLVGKLTGVSAFRIGAGRATAVGDTDLPVVRNAVGEPYIPGSSLKGVLRAYAESLLRAISPGPEWACDPLDNDLRCVKHGDVEGWQQAMRTEKPEERSAKLTQRILDKTCLTCQVFGSPWTASKVNVSDLPVVKKEWFDQYETRNGVAIDRDTGTASDGKLYDFEVVPAGTPFDCRIIIENADDWELGLLAAAVKPFLDGQGAIGGARSRGLGTAKIAWDWSACQQVNADNLIDWLTGEKPPAVEESTYNGWLTALAGKLRGLQSDRKEAVGA